MFDPSQIQEHMEIKGADGGHVGTVDRVEGDRIKLTTSDPSSGGEHQYLDLDAVDRIEEGCVWASAPADACRRMLH